MFAFGYVGFAPIHRSRALAAEQTQRMAGTDHPYLAHQVGSDVPIDPGRSRHSKRPRWLRTRHPYLAHLVGSDVPIDPGRSRQSKRNGWLGQTIPTLRIR